MCEKVIIHNKYSTIKSVYYVVVSYTQTYQNQLVIIYKLVTLNVCAC